MNKQGLGPGRIAVMALFALSCFGLLLFLWNSFGGPVPLKSKGYRVSIPFDQAGQLVSQADVRIAGVPVGKVVAIHQGRRVTDAVVQIEPRYAPLPSDVRATLRQKTLLGETYIELTPGSNAAPKLREGATLARGRVQDQVELDQVLQAFNPDTRRDLGRWLQAWGKSVNGRGEDVSDTIGSLSVAADRGAGVLGILDRQGRAVHDLVSDGASVFGITARRSAALRTIVDAGDRVLATTAARPAELRSAVRRVPGLLTALRTLTVKQRALFRALGPAATGLQPAADDLAPTLRAVDAVAPQLGALGPELASLNRMAPKGMRSARALLRSASPALKELSPLAGTLIPAVKFLDLYRREFVSSWGDVASAGQASITSPDTGRPLHYVRILVPIDDETLELAQTRSKDVRSNPYRAPNGLDAFAHGLKAFSCANTANPTLLPKVGATVPCVPQGPIAFDGKQQDFPMLEPHVLSTPSRGRVTARQRARAVRAPH